MLSDAITDLKESVHLVGLHDRGGSVSGRERVSSRTVQRLQDPKLKRPSTGFNCEIKIGLSLSFQF